MKLYLDTSVYSGYYDEVHKEHTRRLFELINTNGFEVVVSPYVIQELSLSTNELKKEATSLANNRLEITTNAHDDAKIEVLVAEYLDAGVLAKGSIVDATHVAFASLFDVKVIVSNNMRHMVKRQDRFNSVNLRILGKEIFICNPAKTIKEYF